MTLALMGLIESFWAVLGLVVVWALLFAAERPIRQTYLNGLIPSRQRATILSFDSMLSSSGGVVAQPALGRAADVWGYGTSYVISAGISALALPFILLSRRQNDRADVAEGMTREGRPSRGGTEARAPADGLRCPYAEGASWPSVRCVTAREGAEYAIMCSRDSPRACVLADRKAIRQPGLQSRQNASLYFLKYQAGVWDCGPLVWA